MNSLRIYFVLVTIFICTKYMPFALEADFEMTSKDSSSSKVLNKSLFEVDITSKNKKEKLKELELLAENFVNNRFYNRAIDVYENILKYKLPKKKLFEYYLKIGDLYRLNRNYVCSIDSYQKALKINRKNSQVMAKIGNIFLEQKLLIFAEKMFEEALKIDKHSIEATIGKGNILYIQGNYRSAIEYYNKIPKEFYCKEIVKKIVDCYIRLDRLSEAIAVLESFLKEHDDYELILDFTMVCINKDYNTSEGLFFKHLKDNSNDFKTYVYLGFIYDLKGESNKALKMFNKAHAINSSYAVVDFMRAKAAYKMGRTSEAKTYANEAYNKAQTTFVKDQTQRLIKYLSSK